MQHAHSDPPPSAAVKIEYPHTRRVDHVDVLHGVRVPDPYRWLEADVRESPEVAAWVEAQNRVTFAYLESIPEREAIRRRLTELWNYEKYGAPFKRGGRYYFFKNDGLQNQDVLYVMDSLDAEPEVLIDPNTWSKDGTVALAGIAFSDDGRFVAYGVAEAGSDWRTWRVMEIATRRVLEDELKWVKFNTPAWTADGRGFFYARYDEPQPGATFQDINLNQKIYYHRVGTPQSQDVLVYRRPDHPDWGFGVDVTEDGRYLVITIWKGTDDKYRIVYRDLFEPYAMPIDLIENFDHEFTFVGNDGTTFYFKTDWEAEKGRLSAIDITQPQQEHWRVIIPEAEETLRDVNFVGNLFIAEYLKDAKTQVKLYAPDGRFVREVEFPGIGSASGFGGRRGDTETFYTFSSFATPPTIYRYDLITGESRLLRQAKVAFEPDEYEVKQVFYRRKDGTRVPMFIAHRKGLKRDGNNPTLLYGYGGFNIPLTPRFSISRLAWMEMGGVFAMANLRGGGEYGEAWHRAGTKLNKQNVFDDFIAAAEWLMEHKYTRPSKLAIQGGSNGGLLVGACLTQRPDLFGACLPAVGVMDMLRFHKFTAGRFWVDDYGSPENPEEFRALLAYSPYHNIKDGVRYPATLITTADTDDRVVPAHSFKFAARLQAAQAGDAPILIRIETRAGHGAGKPTAKIIEEVADQWAFLVRNLGMNVPYADKRE
ncbi:MAG: S9 family peptidase [Planctomycetota bacterium]|nr:MAG: S9 family peptidase [Planctomycetota bacterium]